MPSKTILPTQTSIIDALLAVQRGEGVHRVRISARSIEMDAKEILLRHERLYLKRAAIERAGLAFTSKPTLTHTLPDGAEEYVFVTDLTEDGEKALIALQRGIAWNPVTREPDLVATEAMFRAELQGRAIDGQFFKVAIANDEPELASVRRDMLFFRLKAEHEASRDLWVIPNETE